MTIAADVALPILLQLAAPAPQAAPRTLPDEVIEHWARVYLANPAIRARGVLFDTFLEAPAEILAAVSAPPAAARPTLLPAQRVAMHRLLDEERVARLDVRRVTLPPRRDAIREWVEVRDGRAVEKLRRRRYARSARARFAPADGSTKP